MWNVVYDLGVALRGRTVYQVIFVCYDKCVTIYILSTKSVLDSLDVFKEINLSIIVLFSYIIPKMYSKWVRW